MCALFSRFLFWEGFMTDIDTSLLGQILAQIISGPLAGTITFWIMEKFVPNTVPSIWRRYLSLLLPAPLAVGAYVLAALAFRYVPAPVGWQAWVETIFAVGFLATTTAQGIHGARKLIKA